MHRERGFTLIEVIVALTIGALVVLLAERLFATVGDGGRALVAARTALDREANARRWLAAAFLSLDVGLEGARSFEGHPGGVTFSSWLETEGGWFAPRRVTLAVDSVRVAARLTPGATVPLEDSVTDLAFDYLLEPGADAHWVREWISRVSAPLAVRVRVTRRGRGMGDGGRVVTDTLLFLIKERG
jgi:prepilin-type N-terminal cleavage/methylation domain-containing protein